MTKKTRHPASKPSKPKPKASKPAAPAAPRDRLRALAPWLGAVFSGVLIFLSFPGFDLQYPIWIALVPLLLASADATPRRAFALGMVTGWLANVVGFFWMEHMLVSFGPPWMAGPVAWIIVALGAVWQALPYGGALALARIAGARGHVWAAVCFLAAFTGLEAFHPILFPWFLGDSQHGIPLPIQIADLVGVYGVTFLVVAVNLALWTLAERFVRRRPVPLGPAWAGAALLAVSLGYGALRIAQVDGAAADLERLRIGVVEPEIPILRGGHVPGADPPPQHPAPPPGHPGPGGPGRRPRPLARVRVVPRALRRRAGRALRAPRPRGRADPRAGRRSLDLGRGALRDPLDGPLRWP